MKDIRDSYVVLSAALIFVMSGYSHGEGMPDNLIGRWQVQEVHINTSSGRTVQYGWDDPRLKWRIFEFARTKVENDAFDFYDRCLSPSIGFIDLNVRDLLFRSVGGYGYPPKSGADPVKDYRLNLDAGKNVRVMSLSCADGIWQGDLGVSYKNLGNLAVRGAWIVLLSNSSLYMRWRDESILRLERVRNDSPVLASFDCAKAGTRTERAICRSYRLGAFDRSVDAAFTKYASQVFGGNRKRAVENQRIWLKKRDACGSDEKCILGQMRSRLDDLFSLD